MWAKVHRWLALLLVVLLVVWSLTGVLFHLKPGWSRAYDMLSAERGSTETLDTVLGPLVRTNGRLAAPLTEVQAQALAADAVARSAHASEYGRLERAVALDHELRLEYAGATVTIDRDTAQIAQTGADTRRIDWLYRMHYLQWTGNRTVDKVLAIAGLALIWAVMIPGLILFAQRLRRR